MNYLDEATRKELVRDIALILVKTQRLAFASDFHAFAQGRTLTLAGVTFETFPKEPNTQRSDGDVVAHAIMMVLAAAVNKGDIDDWFPDKGETNVRSIDYLPEMRRRLIVPDHLVLGTVDVTIVCGEHPRMKKHLAHMQHNIAEGLGIELARKAGNDSLAAVALGHIGNFYVDIGNAQKALDPLESANHLSARSTTPTIRSWLAASEADAYAHQCRALAIAEQTNSLNYAQRLQNFSESYLKNWKRTRIVEKFDYYLQTVQSQFQVLARTENVC